MTPRTMTPAERSLGRFMRAPDGHDGGGSSGSDGGAGASDGGDSAAAAGGSSDAGASGQDDNAGDGDDATALGGAGDETDAGDGAGGDGSDDEAKEGDGDTGDDQVPEAYELKLTQTTKDAEGKDVETEVEMDPVLVEKATPVLKELKLSNEQANALVKLVPDIQARLLEGQNDQFAAMRAEWVKTARADPDIGGKNWSGSLNLAAKALDTLGHPKGSEFRQLLDETGLGNHPAMVKVFRDIGKMIKEDDNLERGDPKAKGKGDRLAELYPDDVPNADKK